MSESVFRREVADGIVTVRVDRPERRNALSRPDWLELGALVEELERDDAVRGLILVGTGDRAFVAGADVRELVDRPPLVALDGAVQRLLLALEDVRFPTVAALNGHALGGGWELALACDLRVAAAHVKVGFPEVGLGIVPGAGGTQRLLQHIGVGRAKELVLTGRLLEAAEALDLGLVNRVVEPGGEVAAARALLDRVLSNSPIAVRLAKGLLNATARGEMAGDLERLAYTLAFHLPDRTERMRRFLDRNPSES